MIMESKGVLKYYVSKFSLILDPPTLPPVSAFSARALPPPLICWRNTWTEGELLVDFYNMFQIIKIYFSIIVRNIFWGVFKEIEA